MAHLAFGRAGGPLAVSGGLSLNKDYTILEPIFGHPYFGKVPSIACDEDATKLAWGSMSTFC